MFKISPDGQQGMGGDGGSLDQLVPAVLIYTAGGTRFLYTYPLEDYIFEGNDDHVLKSVHQANARSKKKNVEVYDYTLYCYIHNDCSLVPASEFPKRYPLRLAPQIHRPAVAPRDVSDRLTGRSDPFASLILAFVQDGSNNIHILRGSEVGFKLLFRCLPQETLMPLGRVEDGEGWWPISAVNLGSK